MAMMVDLPPELILHIVSFLTRKTILDSNDRLPEYNSSKRKLVPDLPSINALSQTSAFHRTLNQTLYRLCVSVEPLGRLALLFAVEHQLESTVDKLVAAGVDLDGDFLAFKFSRCSLLHIAAARGLRDMVAKLMVLYGQEMKARVHARSATHWSALDYAVQKGHIEVVRVLAPIPMPNSGLHHGTVPPPPKPETHKRYLSIALIESVLKKNTEIAEYLISEGADVNFVNWDFEGGAPLYFASGYADVRLVQLLLASGADPNIRGKHGIVPLFNASNIDVAQALLGAGANINAKDNSWRNVLGYFMGKDYRDVEMVRFFLERGVDPNNGDVPGLHLACSQANPAIAKASVELLLQFGARVEQVDWKGRTPVDIAMTRDPKTFLGIVEVLRSSVRNPVLRFKI
ncbi:ankyrin repeat-containing domain protein [Mycena galopus ATCC 62051]|nr:ankyrin repeat-containing domain protein [Mycena galopus ATCC 62051]